MSELRDGIIAEFEFHGADVGRDYVFDGDDRADPERRADRILALVREALRVAFEGVAEGDCGQVSALVSQSLYQGAGMDYHEAGEWSDTIAASVWREVQRRLASPTTED